jgi:hypothetical protein
MGLVFRLLFPSPRMGEGEDGGGYFIILPPESCPARRKEILGYFLNHYIKKPQMKKDRQVYKKYG